FSNYQIGEPPLPKREGEPSFRLVIVRCSAGKNGSDRVRRIGCVWERLGRSWRGTCRVPRTILAGHRRFAGIWGVLGIFGDICSKWAWGAPPAGAEDPSSLDPRSNMNEGLRKDPSSQGPNKLQNPRFNMNERFRQMGGLAGLAGGFESGASHRSPRRWRADGGLIG